MEQPAQQHQVNGAPISANEANGLAIAGFVISLVGLCSGGVLSPIGLILSIVAATRPPRTLAVWGIVLGVIGSCGWLVAIVFIPMIVLGLMVAIGMGAAAAGFAAYFSPEIHTKIELEVLKSQIGMYVDENGKAPGALTDLPNISADSIMLKDGWDHDYVYEVQPDGVTWKLFSMGEDGVAGTADDVEVDSP